MQGDRIACIGPSLPERAEIEIDAAGGLTAPALVEPHLHLDAVLTEGQPRHNRSGSLFEGIEIWGERVPSNVALGHDSIMDPWYPLGIGDPIQSCFVMAHYGQMSGHDELASLLDFVTTRAARCLGVDNHGIAVGRRADLVVFDAPTPVDAIRTLAPRRAVISDGRLVAGTAPRQTTVTVNGQDTLVTFLR